MEENRYMYTNKGWHLAKKRLLLNSHPLSMEKLASQSYTTNREFPNVNQATNQSNAEVTRFQPEMEKASEEISTLGSPISWCIYRNYYCCNTRGGGGSNSICDYPFTHRWNCSLYSSSPNDTCQQNVSLITYPLKNGNKGLTLCTREDVHERKMLLSTHGRTIVLFKQWKNRPHIANNLMN